MTIALRTTQSQTDEVHLMETIVSRSKRAAQRVMQSVSRFITRKLHL